MSALSRLPGHLVPPRRKLRPQSAQNMGLLESMLNRTVLSVQRATHMDILKLGDRYVSKEAPLPVAAEPVSSVDFDGLLMQAQAKFDRELRLAREGLRRELTADKERALAEQKTEFERHLDQVCVLRDKAEDMAKRDLRRACELEKQAALRQLRDSLELQHRADIDRARADERQIARQAAASERAEAVQKALEQAEADFKRREQQTIERTRQECRRQFNEELTGIRKRHRDEVDSGMTKYKELYAKFEQLLDTNRGVANDFHSIQTDYKRFLDYSDGHFHSDYMMKLRRVCVDAASDVSRSAARSGSAVPVISADDLPAAVSAAPSPNRQRLAVQVPARQPQGLLSSRRSPPSPKSPSAPTSARAVMTRHAQVYTDEDVF